MWVGRDGAEKEVKMIEIQYFMCRSLTMNVFVVYCKHSNESERRERKARGAAPWTVS